MVSISPNTFPSAHAAGLVYVNPPTTPIQSVGSTFSVQIQVAGMDPFNGWDVQIQSDPSVINATSLSIVGNVLSANYTLNVLPITNCINGNSCHASGDGMGVVHSAAVALGPLPTYTIDGLLFIITYRVVGSATYSPIQVLSAIITDPRSVPIQTQDGIYGVPPGEGFTFVPSPSSASIRIGSNTNITLTISSFGGYSGTVDISLQPQVGLSLSLNATSTTLSPNQQRVVMLTVATNTTYSASQYMVRVTATSNGLSHTTTLSILTTPKPDFILGVLPSILKIHATNSGSSIITLDTQSGFSGSIRLSMAVPLVPGLIASLGATNLTISPGRPATTVFAVRTPPSDLPFVYLINITASSRSSTHAPFIITVKPPPPDFNFLISGSGYAVQAGKSRSFTLTMTSVDYFKGQLFLLATSLSGAKEVFTRPALALDFGNSSTSMITITTDVNLAPGNHNVTLTALGTTFLGVSVTHVITTTLTVTQVPQQTGTKMILGLQPSIYFGIVGVLWIGVIGAAIREVRRRKPKRFLS